MTQFASTTTAYLNNADLYLYWYAISFAFVLFLILSGIRMFFR